MSGFGGSIELMFAPPYIADKTLFGQRIAQLVQFSLFVDHGEVFVTDAVEGEYESRTLTGYGGGFRLFYKDLVSLKYDLGIPYNKHEETSKDIYHYFGFTMKIF